MYSMLSFKEARRLRMNGMHFLLRIEFGFEYLYYQVQLDQLGEFSEFRFQSIL